jgi:hypothetical protein
MLTLGLSGDHGTLRGGDAALLHDQSVQREDGRVAAGPECPVREDFEDGIEENTTGWEKKLRQIDNRVCDANGPNHCVTD